VSFHRAERDSVRWVCTATIGANHAPHRRALHASAGALYDSAGEAATDPDMTAGPTVLIMAAGEGTRMHSSLPKVLHPVCGRPMVAWVVLAARAAGAARVAVIVSPHHDIAAALPKGTETVIQQEANGTAGAVKAAEELVRQSQTVVVLNGDHPLVTGELLAEVVAAAPASRWAATTSASSSPVTSGWSPLSTTTVWDWRTSSSAEIGRAHV